MSHQYVNYISTVVALLPHNANYIVITLSLYSQDNDSALHWAAYNNNVDVVRVILDYTVQINVKNQVSIIKTTAVLQPYLVQGCIDRLGLLASNCKYFILL